MKPSFLVITLVSLFSILFSACQPIDKGRILKAKVNVKEIKDKVSLAFKSAKKLKQQHTQWFHNRAEKVPLTLIGTAYVHPDIIQTQTYKDLLNLQKTLSRNLQYFGRQTNEKLTQKFSSIKFVDYHTSSLSKQKFNVAFIHRLAEKEKLTDALRPDREKPSAELLIRLNYDALKKGHLQLEGYKTIKSSLKKRNSYYWHLRKEGFLKLSKSKQREALIDALVAAITLSIPEYISVNRSEVLKNKDKVRFTFPNASGGYTRQHWENISDNAVKKLKEKINTFRKKLKPTEFKNNKKISSLVMTADAKIVVTACADGHVRFWDIFSGILLRTLSDGYSHPLTALDISSDDKLIVSAGYQVCLWEYQTGKLLWKFSKMEGNIKAITFSKDSKYILVTRGKEILIISVKTGKLLRRSPIHKSKISYFAISPDGKQVLSAGWESILLWEFETGKIIGKMIEDYSYYHTYKRDDAVRDISMSSDGNYALMSMGKTKTFLLLNLKQNRIEQVFEGHINTVNAVAFLPNGKQVLSGSEDSSVILWDIGKKNSVKTFYSSRNDGKTRRYMVNDIAISPDGKTAIYGGNWGYLSHLDLENKKKFISSKQVDNKNAYKNIDALSQEIKNIKSLKKFQEHDYKQKILTSPVSGNDIAILIKRNYLTIAKKKLTTKELIQLAQSLNMNYHDPVLLLAFSKRYKSYVKNKIKVQGETIMLYKRKNYDIDSIYLRSNFDYKEQGYILVKEKKASSIEALENR